jgi:hypothetical protein
VSVTGAEEIGQRRKVLYTVGIATSARSAIIA